MPATSCARSPAISSVDFSATHCPAQNARIPEGRTSSAKLVQGDAFGCLPRGSKIFLEKLLDSSSVMGSVPVVQKSRALNLTGLPGGGGAAFLGMRGAISFK